MFIALPRGGWTYSSTGDRHHQSSCSSQVRRSAIHVSSSPSDRRPRVGGWWTVIGSARRKSCGPAAVPHRGRELRNQPGRKRLGRDPSQRRVARSSQQVPGSTRASVRAGGVVPTIARLREHRLQAPRCTPPLGPLQDIGQGEEPGEPGYSPGARVSVVRAGSATKARPDNYGAL